MIALAASIAVLAGLAGLYLSYYAGTAGGASVALAIVAAYLLSLPVGWLAAGGDPGRTDRRATIAEMTTRPTPAGPSTRSRPCRRPATAAAAPARRWSRRSPATTAPSPRWTSTTSCAERKPPVGRASVYRALEQLEELGLVPAGRGLPRHRRL